VTGVETAAVQRHALTHPDEAVPAAGNGRGGSPAVVDDLEFERLGAVVDTDGGLRLAPSSLHGATILGIVFLTGALCGAVASGIDAAFRGWDTRRFVAAIAAGPLAFLGAILFFVVLGAIIRLWRTALSE